MQKLNSMRFLDSKKVAYTIHEYTYDTDNPPDASAVADQIGLPHSSVYKTLVLTGASNGKPVLVMLASNDHLDLKRCAASIKQKRLEMMPRTETERLTGLKIGGIGSFALVPKHWPSYLDNSAKLIDTMYVNAGQRGVMLGLKVADVMRLLNAPLIDAAVRPATE